MDSSSVSLADASASVSQREVLKLSELDAGLVSDLSSMFGKWYETDHCDKDDR